MQVRPVELLLLRQPSGHLTISIVGSEEDSPHAVQPPELAELLHVHLPRICKTAGAQAATRGGTSGEDFLRS